MLNKEICKKCIINTASSRNIPDLGWKNPVETRWLHHRVMCPTQNGWEEHKPLDHVPEWCLYPLEQVLKEQTDTM